ncbi:MAG: signal peptidase II [Gemmatimonadales bacterium]
MRSGAESRRLFLGAGLAILALDIVTKRLAERFLLPVPPVDLLGETVRLRLVFNQGAAFGLDLGAFQRWIFLGIAVGAIVLLWRLARSSAPDDRLRQLSCGLVAGGAAGNLLDRIRSSRGVVDFIDIGVGAVRWPTFNVADIGVSLGAIALAVSLWLEDARRARAGTVPSA